MPRYRCTAGHPLPDGEGGMIRPQEIRELDEPPADWPWEEVPPEPEPQDGPLPLDAPGGPPEDGGDGPLPVDAPTDPPASDEGGAAALSAPGRPRKDKSTATGTGE